MGSDRSGDVDVQPGHAVTKGELVHVLAELAAV